MVPRITRATHVKSHTIRIRFSDGTQGDVDLADALDGEVFAGLKRVSAFKRFRIHPELHTLTWPNGADFAPEFLYERVKVNA